MTTLESSTVEADATPEKRLFISLLTRDISLVAAFLDLIDNSINAALEPRANKLLTADDYMKVFADKRVKPKVNISLTFGDERVEIKDNAAGISAEDAQTGVFKFGRSEESSDESDRLSVYGIGLKRAIFKMGDHIQMRSDHRDGGFDLDLRVSTWARIREPKWTFPISRREPARERDWGTTIVVTGLHKEVRQRLSDGVFEGQLRDAVGRTYAFYLGRLVTISINGTDIQGTNLGLSENRAAETIAMGTVTCAIAAGLGPSEGGQFRDRSAGWFVFCNGRGVISADKSPLTGWGSGGLPLFQPKHRPFLGIVLFVSANPEALPWTTTKASIDEDSSVWQTAKRQMVVVGRAVTQFLDSRYQEDGTAVAPKDLEDAREGEVPALRAASGGARAFKPPKGKTSTTTSIQYSARVADVRRIGTYLGRPSMSGSEVGRHTFDFFLRNEVDAE
jgi:hypothetical protein